MALALAPRSEEEQSDDMAALFDFFDDDNSGHITLEEVALKIKEKAYEPLLIRLDNSVKQK